MSHYAVLVIGEDVEGQLAPYDENIEMPEYKKDLVSKEDLESFTKIYTIYDKDRSYGAKEDEVKENSKLSFEDLYKKFGKDWNGNTWKKHSNGEWAEYSTYNPKSKWDWFEIGGRWAGMFKVKKDVDKSKYENLNFSHGWDEEDKKEIMKQRKADQIRKGDVDFSIDKKVLKKAERFWELYIDGDKPKNEEEKEMIKFVFNKKEYYVERYKDKETYARINSEFGTFAVLKDGEWFEKGEMGWFGCSSETDKESTEWDNSFFDKFIKDLPDDTLLTVVDCHI